MYSEKTQEYIKYRDNKIAGELLAAARKNDTAVFQRFAIFFRNNERRNEIVAKERAAAVAKEKV